MRHEARVAVASRPGYDRAYPYAEEAYDVPQDASPPAHHGGIFRRRPTPIAVLNRPTRRAALLPRTSGLRLPGSAFRTLLESAPREPVLHLGIIPYRNNVKRARSGCGSFFRPHQTSDSLKSLTSRLVIPGRGLSPANPESIVPQMEVERWNGLVQTANWR